MASKTFDITTLAGYADVSLGSHQLTIISEADGYIDSDPSTPVTFINGYPITFNLTHCTRTPVSNAVDRFNDTTFNITADTNYKLPTSITVSGSNYDWNGSTGVLTIKEVTGQVTVTIAAVQDVFAITKSATNGAWTGASTISAGGTAILTLTPNTNYKLPTSVNVTGASQSWNASTGKLTLTNPTGAVNVTATCPIITYNITETLTNVTKSGTHPTTINAGSTVTLKYVANANYELPNSVTVTGATSTWTKSTGTLTISNPTADVSITIVASLPQLSAPANVTADGTTVSWDAVENATSYAVLADGSEIGTVEVPVAEDALAGTWVFNDNINTEYGNIFNVELNFICSGVSYCSIQRVYGPFAESPFEPPVDVNFLAYYTDSSSNIQVYTDSGWIDESYKTITITSKLSEVTDGNQLLAWLQTNATKQ